MKEAIREKTKRAAMQARDSINSGSTVTHANEIFNGIAGFYLSHSGKRDFMRLVNFYADN